MTKPEAVMRCTRIRHTFEGAAGPVLSDIDLTVRRGEFVALVGASGSGKTTILRILAGLLDPTGGRVTVASGDVTGQPGEDRTMVFQDDRLFPWRTSLENIVFGLQVKGESKEERNVQGLKILELVGLAGSAHLYPGELSGGMRQRVNVGRALVMDPDYLLMDEPFAALDAQTRELMQGELLRILAQTSVGVLFVTHQIEEALFLADRVVVLGANPGRIRTQLEVPFERPRSLRIKREQQFQEFYDVVWREIEDDVKATMRLTKEL